MSLPRLVESITGVFSRLSSNQAAPDIEPVERSDKPRVNGIGRPKRYKAKPYDRPEPRTNDNTRPGRRHVSIRAPSTGSRASSVHSPWGTGITGSQVVLEDIEDHNEEGVCVDEEYEGADITLKTEPEDVVATSATPTPTRTPSTADSTAPATRPATTAPAAVPEDLYIRIPAHLQRPVFPPMAHMLLDDEEIPADYVRYHLSPHLAKIQHVGTLYRPVSYAESPAAGTPHTILNEHGLAQSMAFGIPALLSGHDAELASYVAGYEPDLLLAIVRPTGTGPKYFLKPVKHIVYASHCRLFPSMPANPLSMHFVHPNHASDSEADDSDSEDENDDDGHDRPASRPGTSMSTHSTSSTSSSDTTVSSTTAASDVASLDTGDYIHLPILGLEVPSPETFDLVHNQLHRPGRFEPTLLELTPHQAVNPSTAHAALDTLTTRELNRRLTRTHGVWANMCALGVDDDAMWTQIDRAYGMLLAALRRRALPHRVSQPFVSSS